MIGFFKSTVGLRAVAVFEVAKGLGALILTIVFLNLVHKGEAEGAAQSLLHQLHIDPSRRIYAAIVETLARPTQAQLWGVAALALAYFAVRLTEAWGLWFARAWAEWFSLLSGAIYLPWEVTELVTRPSWLSASLVAGNTAIVLYMGFLRMQDRRKSNVT